MAGANRVSPGKRGTESQKNYKRHDVTINDTGKVVVIEFVTLDGVMQAPGSPDEDGSNGFKYGVWTVPYDDELPPG